MAPGGAKAAPRGPFAPPARKTPAAEQRQRSMGRSGPRGLPQQPQASEAWAAPATAPAQPAPAAAAERAGNRRKSRNRRARSRAKSANPSGGNMADNQGPLSRMMSNLTSNFTKTDAGDQTGASSAATGSRWPAGTPMPPKQAEESPAQQASGRSRNKSKNRRNRRAKSMQPTEQMVLVWRPKYPQPETNTAAAGMADEVAAAPSDNGQPEPSADATPAAPTEIIVNTGVEAEPEDPAQDLTVEATSMGNERIAITDPVLKQKLEARRRRAEERLDGDAAEQAFPRSPVNHERKLEPLLQQKLENQRRKAEGSEAKAEEASFDAGVAASASEKTPEERVLALLQSAVWTLADLQNKNKCQAAGLEMNKREEYLSDEEFYATFGTSKDLFAALPEWKRNTQKKEHGLF